MFFFLFLSVTVSEAQTPQTAREKSYVKPNSVFPAAGSDTAHAGVFTVPGRTVPETAIEELPVTPFFIMGKGESSAEKLALFLIHENNNTDREFAEELAALYIAEAATEGINHDLAFAQMCLETGFLRYGGLVIPEMNNFCGLGSIGPGQSGEWFPSVEFGVRAHIQHLQAYASEEPLAGDLVDPRYFFVRRGSSPVLRDLSGTWAADKLYAEKIELILGRLVLFGCEVLEPF